MEPVNINQIRNSMQVGANARAQSIRQNDAAPDAAKTGESRANSSKDAAVKVQNQAEDAAAKGIYGDVLDISEDGDTVTARPEALQALDDGLVVLREDRAKDTSAAELEAMEAERRREIEEARMEEAEASREARREIREKNEERAEEESDASNVSSGSLKGYSDDMIDTLYRQGKIDSREYNTEVDRRARLDEELSPKEDDNKSGAAENNEQFSKTMGALNAESDRDRLESEALLTAAENGRVDLIKDIFAEDSNQ